MGAARLLLPRFENAASVSARLFSSSAALVWRPWTLFSDDSGDSDGERSVYKRALKFQRPTTVRYDDILPNSVSLIGRVVRPLKPCNSPQIGFHTMLRVKAPSGASPYFSILLNFWDEMAEISVQHLKLDDLIYVSGRLGSYMKVDESGKLTHRCKVVVTEINFVAQRGLGPAYQNLAKLEPAVSAEDIMQKRRDRIHLWQIFFANPYEWWDNRNCKQSPKAPDFRHKDTGEALWLQNNDPPWIKKQLQLLDSRFKQSPGECRNGWSHLSPLVYHDT